VLRAENLSVALAGGDEDCGAGHHEHEPSRQRDRRRHPTGDGSEHEPAGDRNQVEQEDLDRLYAAILTSVIGEGAREVATAKTRRQANTIIDAVIGYARRLLAGLDCLVVQDIVMTRTSQRTNDIMRVLTVISSVLLPAVVVGGVMGMNFHPAFFDEPSYFFVVVGIMVALAVLTLFLARRRGWL